MNLKLTASEAWAIISHQFALLPYGETMWLAWDTLRGIHQAILTLETQDRLEHGDTYEITCDESDLKQLARTLNPQYYEGSMPVGKTLLKKIFKVLREAEGEQEEPMPAWIEAALEEHHDGNDKPSPRPSQNANTEPYTDPYTD